MSHLALGTVSLVGAAVVMLPALALRGLPVVGVVAALIAFPAFASITPLALRTIYQEFSANRWRRDLLCCDH